MGAFASGFISQDAKYFGFRGRQFHVVPNAHEHRFRGATFLDHQRSPLIAHTLEELAETRASAQRGDDNGFIWVG